MPPDHGQPAAARALQDGLLQGIHIGGDVLSPLEYKLCLASNSNTAGLEGPMSKIPTDQLRDLEAAASFDASLNGGIDPEELDCNDLDRALGLEEWSEGDISWILDPKNALEGRTAATAEVPATECFAEMQMPSKGLACRTTTFTTAPGSLDPDAACHLNNATPHSVHSSDVSLDTIFRSSTASPHRQSAAMKQAGPAFDQTLADLLSPIPLAAENPELHPAPALGDQGCINSPRHQILAEMYGLELAALLSPEAQKRDSPQQWGFSGRPKLSAIVR